MNDGYERRVYLTAEDCDRWGHLWQSKEGSQTYHITTPLGEITVKDGYGTAYVDGAGTWTLYDCASCGAVEAVQHKSDRPR